MFRLACFCFLIIGLSAGRPAHDFHASVTQMQYNPKDRVFEISIRVFTDDLEKALGTLTSEKINLDSKAKTDPLIEKYIRTHFAYVNPQKQPKPFQYIGYETEADAHWLYLEMPYAEPFRGGLLRQNVFMELFDDQVNMVNVQYQGQKKTFVFRKNQSVQEISIQ
ncbi:hypothetical protein GGR92_002104 [Spirosoma lacussanchae]|uniref:DUF6702 family protein n=1 Tax=Spirosoma lacussanchae TaxID=1884249 RepID=UPI001FE8E16E|nr:DUF6702 family protein [Spirosoma lacussanchae]